MRERTRGLHRCAERSGVVREILAGKVTRLRYALLLRNLLPVYRNLEQGLQRHRRSPAVRFIVFPQLYRSERIAADLKAICGDAWASDLPLLDPGRRYADRVADVARGDGQKLIAHAYTRFLGDLNGGQALRAILGRSLHLEASALAFYEFTDVENPGTLVERYCRCFEHATAEIDDCEGVIGEAEAAFAFNIELALAVSCSGQ